MWGRYKRGVSGPQAIILMVIAAAAAVALEPLYPGGLADKVGTLQGWVDSSAASNNELNRAGSGVITVKSIAPTEDVCLTVGCDGGTIPMRNKGQITIFIEVEPVNPIVNRDYTVWLADRDGITLNAEPFRWSSDELQPPPRGERSRSAVAAAVEGRVKSVALTIPFDDVSVPDFVEDYNAVFLYGLEKYETKVSDECEFRIGSGSNGWLLVGNSECLSQRFPPYEMGANELKEVLSRHYRIELMLESEFLDRGLSKHDQAER